MTGLSALGLTSTVAAAATGAGVPRVSVASEVRRRAIAMARGAFLPGRATKKWGNGAVRLVEPPADEEYYDNIVSFWRPMAGLKKLECRLPMPTV